MNSVRMLSRVAFWGVSLQLPHILAIYAPMIYTAPCVMFWMRADPLRGQVGGLGPGN
jgi:hypothetical protein